MPPREGTALSPGPVLALWPPVARGRRPKRSAVIFFEVEILDARTRDKLCFLDKVRGQRGDSAGGDTGVAPASPERHSLSPGGASGHRGRHQEPVQQSP